MRVKAMAYAGSYWHWINLSERLSGGWHPRVCRQGTDFELDPIERQSPRYLEPLIPCPDCQQWATQHNLPTHQTLMERLRQALEGVAAAQQTAQLWTTYETEPPSATT